MSETMWKIVHRSQKQCEENVFQICQRVGNRATTTDDILGILPALFAMLHKTQPGEPVVVLRRAYCPVTQEFTEDMTQTEQRKKLDELFASKKIGHQTKTPECLRRINTGYYIIYLWASQEQVLDAVKTLFNNKNRFKLSLKFGNSQFKQITRNMSDTDIQTIITELFDQNTDILTNTEPQKRERVRVKDYLCPIDSCKGYLITPDRIPATPESVLSIVEYLLTHKKEFYLKYIGCSEHFPISRDMSYEKIKAQIELAFEKGKESAQSPKVKNASAEKPKKRKPSKPTIGTGCVPYYQLKKEGLFYTVPFKKDVTKDEILAALEFLFSKSRKGYGDTLRIRIAGLTHVTRMVSKNNSAKWDTYAQELVDIRDGIIPKPDPVPETENMETPNKKQTSENDHVHPSEYEVKPTVCADLVPGTDRDPTEQIRSGFKNTKKYRQKYALAYNPFTETDKTTFGQKINYICKKIRNELKAEKDTEKLKETINILNKVYDILSKGCTWKINPNTEYTPENQIFDCYKNGKEFKNLLNQLEEFVNNAIQQKAMVEQSPEELKILHEKVVEIRESLEKKKEKGEQYV